MNIDINDPSKAVRDLLAAGYSSELVPSLVLAASDTSALKWMAERWLRSEVTVAERCTGKAQEREASLVAYEEERRRKRNAAGAESRQRSRDEKAAAQAAGYTDVSQYREDRITSLFQQVAEQWKPIEAAMAFTEAFLDTEFKLGDGTKVRWGDATLDDHLTRITYMTKMIEGHQEDVRLHEQIVALITESGARTLREIRAVAV